MAMTAWKNAGIELILLGTGGSFDLKTNYATYGLGATDYLSLTANDFIVDVTGGGANTYSFSIQGLNSVTATATFSKSYNATTGILTISLSASGQTGPYGATAQFTKNVYLKR